MTPIRSAVLALALAIGGGGASAATLDFEGVPLQSGFTSITEDGFTLSVTDSNGSVIDDSSGVCSGGACPSNGTQIVLGASGAAFTFTLTANDGSAFSLTSFDGGEGFEPSVDADGIRLVGAIFGGGSVTEDFTLDQANDGPGGAADFQTFNPLSLLNLTSVTFSPIGTAPNAFTLDNIVVSAAVPLPATLSLMMAAAGGLGMLAWRRKKA